MPAIKIFSVCLIVIVGLMPSHHRTLTFEDYREPLGCCNRHGLSPERSKIGNMPHGRRYPDKPIPTWKAYGELFARLDGVRAIRLPSFELCRRRRPTHLARALARPVQNDRKKHTDHPVCFIAYFKLFSTNLTNMAEPTGMQASSTINFGW